MGIFSIHKDFRKELRQQSASIFGRGRFLFHLLIWGYLIYTRVKNNPQGELVGAGGIQGLEAYFRARFFVKLFGLTGFIYSFLLLIIPYARYQKKRFILWLGLTANVFFWIIATICLNYLLFQFFPTGLALQQRNIAAALGNMSSVMVASAGLGYNVGYFSTGMLTVLWVFFSFYYYMDLYDQQRNLNNYQKVLADKLEAESVFLKSQINPHFLFNTLNNVYSLALQQADDAPSIARQLKNLLHYMLYDCQQDQVPLQGEIEFLRNYTALEQLRNKQEVVDIKVEVAGDTTGKVIAPFLLINFVENAFKHGVKAGIEKAYVHIRIYAMENSLALEVANSKPGQHANKGMAVQQAGGIGIQNVKRRLAILYPKKHKLNISDNAESYTIYLQITL